MMESTVRTIENIQMMLATGKSRPEVAKSLGYKDVTALYHFASRHKLKWNNEKNNYDATGNDGKPIEAVKTPEDKPTGKVANIIAMFEQGMSGKEIAKKLKFPSHQALADYMKSNGYRWNDHKQNYMLLPQKIEDATDDKKEKAIDKGGGNKKAAVKAEPKTDNINIINENHIRLLNLILAHEDKLKSLLIDEESPETMGRYRLVGGCITKTVGMNENLEHLVKEYSKEYDIRQQDIFQTALIEFLKKYGYADEVKANLKV